MFVGEKCILRSSRSLSPLPPLLWPCCPHRDRLHMYAIRRHIQTLLCACTRLPSTARPVPDFLTLHIRASPEFGYGHKPCVVRGTKIPPSSTLIYNIELMDWHQGGNMGEGLCVTRRGIPLRFGHLVRREWVFMVITRQNACWCGSVTAPVSSLAHMARTRCCNRHMLAIAWGDLLGAVHVRKLLCVGAAREVAERKIPPGTRDMIFQRSSTWVDIDRARFGQQECAHLHVAFCTWIARQSGGRARDQKAPWPRHQWAHQGTCTARQGCLEFHNAA